MGVQISNNAYSTLASGISNVATSLSVQSGEGARFPSASVASGNYFYVTLINTANQLEIVKVTDRTTDTFTIVRGQDGTTARAYSINDRVELRPVAAMLNALPNRALVTADYTDASVTTVKLANSGVTAGSYGGLGKDLSITVNSKGQVTSLSETGGLIQTNTFSFTTSGATQTWTKPSVGSLVRVQLWGGGGGGGRGATGDGRGAGGGGGYIEAWYKLADLDSTASIVVGGGGAGATTTVAGNNGESSTFTSGSISLTAYAGSGGAGSGAGHGGGGGAGAFATGTSPDGGRFGGGKGATYDTGTTTYTGAEDAQSMWGGGGGGAGSYTNANATYQTGGYAIWGGGGGGGGYNGTGTSSGGTSIFGGSGGSGGTDTTVGGNGATPGGGGGGAEVANGGNGGNGRCIVTVF